MNSLLEGQFGDANLEDCDNLVRLLIAQRGIAWYESLFEGFQFDNE